MKKYTAIWGSDEAGIWTEGYSRQVLSARELDKLNIDLMVVIQGDWSDTAIDDLVDQNNRRMAVRRK